MKSSKLKAIARGKMLGKYNTAAGALVLIQLLLFVVNAIVSGVVDTTTSSGMIMFAAISIIINLIASVLVVGELSIYMNLAVGNPAKVTDVFGYFKGQTDRIIITELLMALRLLVWMIPVGSVAAWTELNGLATDESVIITGAILIICGCGMIYTIISLSQCYYLILDFPQYSASEVVKLSAKIMKGHKLSYLWLAISFIPMMILAVLSCGIGMLFVYPYMRMTMTEFYLDIIRE